MVFTALEDDQVMAPPDLCNQWLHFWHLTVRKVEFPHVEDISAGITAYAGKFPPKVCSQLLCDSGSVVGVSLTLNNQPSNIPVQPLTPC